MSWVGGLEAGEDINLRVCGPHSWEMSAVKRWMRVPVIWRNCLKVDRCSIVGTWERLCRESTFYIILIREVQLVLWTGHECTPEGTSVLPRLKTRKVNVTIHAAFLEGLREVLLINVIIIEESYHNGKIIVSIYLMSEKTAYIVQIGQTD